MKLLNKIVNKFGYTLTSNKPALPSDILADQTFIEIFNQCRPFTMTSAERMFSLYQSVKYLEENNIEGDFVECGVWKGGSCMLMALTLLNLKSTSRKIFLYDTFEGMSAPTGKDTVAGKGDLASELLNSSDKNDPNSVWCYSTLDEVKANINRVGYPLSSIKFIKGKVEDTIPGEIPEKIALLRLDTDWYESTYHELSHLYDLLGKNGILIIDDFGFWEGAKKAVIQFFNERRLYPIINRIDDTGRIIIKTENMI